MKYHGHEIKKVYDYDVIGGSYYEIYRDGKHITDFLLMWHCKSFIDSYDGNDYDRSLIRWRELISAVYVVKSSKGMGTTHTHSLKEIIKSVATNVIFNL